jgi:hypothetical protein
MVADEFTYDVKVPKELTMLLDNTEAIKQVRNALREIQEAVLEITAGASMRYPNSETILGFEGSKILRDGKRTFEISNGERKVIITIELQK